MTDREIKHSGIQTVGYIEREDGELILTNYDPDKPFYIFGQENMTPEEYERAVERMRPGMKMAREYFQRKYEELNPVSKPTRGQSHHHHPFSSRYRFAQSVSRRR